jgi:signal transduction histidine kinase
MLSNLLSNAIRHSPPGAFVGLSIRREEQSAVIAVADQGPGIPPALRERIFERFYSLDQARSQEPSSSGLGLAIVRRVVEAHGGNVSVESQEGKGSTFWVRLPVLAAVNG